MQQEWDSSLRMRCNRVMGQWNKNTVPKCKERQYSDEVLVTVKKGQCSTVLKAIYIPYHHVTSEDSGWCTEDGIPDNWEYIEEEDDFWIPEGWYEACDNCRDATYFLIDGKVTAWMNMPKPYEPRIKDLADF